MNGELSQVAKLDPKWVKEEHRRELRYFASLVIAIAAIAGATYAVVVNERQDSTITRLSQCEQNAQSVECQDLRERAAKAQTVEVACITLEQAGYPCPRPGSRADKAVNTPSDYTPRGKGGGATTGTTPPSISEPSPGGSTGNGKDVSADPGGKKLPITPPASGPSTPTTPPASTPVTTPPSTPPVSESANTPIRDILAPVVQPVLETVTGTTCELGLLCPR